MKILVTGGAGFIGSHVVDAYIAAGHSVAVVDNLHSGRRENVNRKARFYNGDIRDTKKIASIFKTERPELLNHHAALVHVYQSVLNPAETIDVNVAGTAAVCNAMAIHGAGRKKIVFISSSAVYGDATKIPVSETATVKPLSPYGLSKLLGEEEVKFFAREHKIPYTIFRYTNVYGTRQLPGTGVVPIFFDMMRRGKTPTIYGDGSKSRDYLFVDDLTRAHIAAIKKANNETLNLGGGTRITDKKMYNEIASRCEFSKKPVFAPFRSGEIRTMALSAAKAQRLLGWKPTTSLSAGLDTIAQWFRKKG